jgi:hypothetical protein
VSLAGGATTAGFGGFCILAGDEFDSVVVSLATVVELFLDLKIVPR